MHAREPRLIGRTGLDVAGGIQELDLSPNQHAAGLIDHDTGNRRARLGLRGKPGGEQNEHRKCCRQE